MANRFWVGGTASWDATAGVKWATVSAGAGGAAVPTSADDVFFDAASGAVTVTVVAGGGTCQNLDFTGFTGTFGGDGSTPATVFGNLTLVAGMTLAAGLTNFTFASTAAGKTITSNGKSIPNNAVFNGVGGAWTLQDAFNVGTNTITLTNGTLDTNGKTVTAAAIVSAAGASTLTLGASTLTLSGAVPIDFTVGAPTLNANTSTISCSANTAFFKGGGKTFNTVNFTDVVGGGRGISGANTFATLTISTGATASHTFDLFANQTITGTFTYNGNSSSNRPILRSDTVGTARTVTAAVFAPTDLDFRDIAGAGAASPFAGTRVGDCKGNSGITFTGAANKFWVGNTASWNSVSWATVSGGAAAANNYPLPQDTSIFDANSFSANGQTVTSSGGGNGRFGGIDFTAITKTGITLSLGGGSMTLHGNLVLKNGMTVSSNAFVFSGRAAPQTITSNGVSIGSQIIVDSFGGTVRLSDPLTSSLAFTHTRGTFDMNGQAVNLPSFSSGTIDVRAITSGGATMTLTGNNTLILSVSNATNLSLNDALQIDCAYSGAVGSRTIDWGVTAGTENNAASIRVSAGTDTVNHSTNANYKNLDFTGFAGTFSAAGFTLFGDLTLAAGMTVGASANALQFRATSGTKTITSNGKTMDFPVTFNGVGGTWQLSDAATLGSTRAGTVTAGTLDLNGKTFTVGNLGATGVIARSITSGLAGGKIATLTTTNGASAFSGAAPGNNLTLANRSNWSIEIGGNTANIRAFSGSGNTYPALTFTNTTPNGELQILGSNTFKSLAVSSAPQAIKFTAGTTTTIEDDHGFPAGTGAGSRVTIGSITAANHALAKVGGGRVSRDFLSISRSDASPGTTWYAGNSSVDGGNNSGWIFTSPPKNDAMMMMFKP